MKRIFSLFLAAALLLLCVSCAPEENSTEFFSMNTVMRISATGNGSEEAIRAARAEVERLDKLLSRQLQTSEVARLNREAGSGEALDVGPELFELLKRSQECSAQFDGAFDVTIAPVKDAWGGFTEEDHRIPQQAELNELLPLVDSSAMVLDESRSTALLPRAGMAVDLGAIAKGYAAARAEAVLRDSGIRSALMDLGHNITVIGRKPDGELWRIGVVDPKHPTGDPLGIVSISDCTCSTSGGYERYFQQDGVTYHHILDPKTGCPAQSGLSSVTIVSPDATLADALSTALFVLGPDQALDHWRQSENFEMILCETDGTVTVTEGLEKGFTHPDTDGGYTYEIARR